MASISNFIETAVNMAEMAQKPFGSSPSDQASTDLSFQGLLAQLLPQAIPQVSAEHPSINLEQDLSLQALASVEALAPSTIAQTIEATLLASPIEGEIDPNAVETFETPESKEVILPQTSKDIAGKLLVDQAITKQSEELAGKFKLDESFELQALSETQEITLNTKENESPIKSTQGNAEDLLNQLENQLKLSSDSASAQNQQNLNLEKKFSSIQAQESSTNENKNEISFDQVIDNQLGIQSQALAVEQPSLAKASSNVSAPIETQVSDGIEAIYNSDKQEITIQLNPENLGKVEIKLSKNPLNTENDMQAVLTVSSAETKQYLGKKLDDLSKVLAEKGIQMGRLEIIERPIQQTQAHHQQQNQLEYQNQSNWQQSQNQAQNFANFNQQNNQNSNSSTQNNYIATSNSFNLSDIAENETQPEQLQVGQINLRI